ncbi:nucleotide exchange factor GrpE [Caproiciproducens sp. CPB-2]|uniref:nucleotide exchange factor GrpE n=1 Tax=Caproiciproducens sp. CPB-2 TaxID=3030017 RepID=UPI0023DB9073|nr:nucleotide exchange factor GrpE [Caproiciproducens sp. CPB-2]MDF1494347.1 nucleotide exchange factor GrpE [Caproiciproducens sp. CPB-2]
MEKNQKEQVDKKQAKASGTPEKASAGKPEETSKAEKARAGEAAAAENPAGQEKPKDDAQARLEQAQEELKKQKELLLRTAAEYDNYRKRTEREKTAVYADATAAAVTEFLPVADNLERALKQQDCTVEDLRKGVEMVGVQLKGALAKLGVTEMGEAGEIFNPDLHNAVSHVEDENAGENTVVQVFQKGYKIGDKIVRHAMVQVAN